MKASGIEAWEKRLAGLERAALRGAEDGMEDALRAMAATLADYPPELPNQKYIRTNALHDGWTDAVPVFVVESTGITGTITNPVSYAPEVEGDGTQKDIHVGRWPTVGGVQEAQEGAARAAVEASVIAGVQRG